jgi:hypothetical protein
MAAMELRASGTMITTDLTTHTVRAFVPSIPCDQSVEIFGAAQQDTDSDFDVYGQKYAPSADSLGPPRMGNTDSGAPTFVDNFGPATSRDQYPAWSAERNIPLSKEEIEDIFLDLTQKFGFQRDSMRNMVCLFSLLGYTSV